MIVASVIVILRNPTAVGVVDLDVNADESDARVVAGNGKSESSKLPSTEDELLGAAVKASLAESEAEVDASNIVCGGITDEVTGC